MNCEIEKSGVITIRLNVVNTLLLQNRKQHEYEDGSVSWTPCPNGRLRDILTEMLRIALLITDFPVVGLNLRTWIRTWLIQKLLQQTCQESQQK